MNRPPARPDAWGKAPTPYLRPVTVPASDSDDSSALSLSLSGQSDSEWGPLPERDTRVPVPVDALPPLLRDYTAGLCEQLQVPHDLVLLLSLATLAGATRGRWRVDGPGPGWHEHLTLYTAVFLPPGEMKSPTLREVAQPLRDYERQLVADSAEHVARESERRLMLEARVKSLRGQVARRAMDVDLAAEHDEAVQHLTACPAVHTPQLLVQDVTPERLAVMLAEQGGSLTVLNAEGGLMATLAGRYSDGVANLDLVNSAHSGERVTVDRQGRDPVHLDTPHLAMGLAVQPDVLRELQGNREMRTRGFMDRFLLAVPDSRLGRRKLEPAALDDTVRDGWHFGVRRLLDAATVQLDAGTFTALQLSTGAREAFRQYRRQHEPRLGGDGDLAHVTGWGNKLPGQLLRIAGLLTVLDDPAASTVGTEAMHAALALSGYLVGQALFVHGHPVTGPTARVLAAVSAWPSPVFPTRELHRKVQGQTWCTGADAVQTELTQLQVAGFVKRLPNEYGSKSERWERHPDLVRTSTGNGP